MKTHAIRIHETGGPEKMRWEEIDLPQPGAQEVLIRHEAIGLNFIDTYHRSGLYALPLPTALGVEAAGIVESLGKEVRDLQIGDRVAYVSQPGAYAERRVIAASQVIRLPNTVDARQAAALLSKGMTVEYLIRRTYRVMPGDWILLHAAAGGVGSIAAQWLKDLGAKTIGTVGSQKKIALAQSYGCDHVLDYSQSGWEKEVRSLTQGQGVHVVYDGVGKDTFLSSLDCLRPRGMMVTFGNASGPVPAIEPISLARKGSLYLTRPTLGHYTANREDLLASANAVFDVVQKGAVKVAIGATYPLKDAALAHQDLHQRKITGSALLLP